MNEFNREVLKRVVEDGVTSTPAPGVKQPMPTWRKEFTPFGHRINFLSAERQHLQTGKLRILPPKNPEKRD